MITPTYLQTMAAYNHWQNGLVLSLVDDLSDEQRQRDLSGFFGSIEQTLNHILWADQYWMYRLAGTEKPQAASIASSTRLYPDYPAFRTARLTFDQRIVDWARSATQKDIDGELTWFSRSADREMTSSRARCMTHMFNHQTHHRGQTHQMLSSLRIKTKVSDLVFMPEDLI